MSLSSPPLLQPISAHPRFGLELIFTPCACRYRSRSLRTANTSCHPRGRSSQHLASLFTLTLNLRHNAIVLQQSSPSLLLHLLEGFCKSIALLPNRDSAPLGGELFLYTMELLAEPRFDVLANLGIRYILRQADLLFGGEKNFCTNSKCTSARTTVSFEGRGKDASRFR